MLLSHSPNPEVTGKRGNKKPQLKPKSAEAASKKDFSIFDIFIDFSNKGCKVVIRTTQQSDPKKPLPKAFKELKQSGSVKSALMSDQLPTLQAGLSFTCL